MPDDNVPDEIVPDEKDWTWVLERTCPECGFEAGSIDVRRIGDAIRANAETWSEVLGGDHAAVRADRLPIAGRRSSTARTCATSTTCSSGDCG